MPCYTVTTIEVRFQRENLNLLLSASDALQYQRIGVTATEVRIAGLGWLGTLDLETGTIAINSQSFNPSEAQQIAQDVSNSLKRQYSELAIQAAASSQHLTVEWQPNRLQATVRC